MYMTPNRILSKTVIVLLLFALGVRSVVPQGLMIESNSTALFGFEIVLCDGNKGLGSIPAFQRNVPDHAVHAMHHPDTHQVDQADRPTQHRHEDDTCSECDFLWAGSGFEETVQVDIDIPIQFFAETIQVAPNQDVTFFRSAYRYLSRAPPLYSIL